METLFLRNVGLVVAGAVAVVVVVVVNDQLLRDEKSKIYKFIMVTIGIHVIGRTVASRTFDSKKLLQF
jgi:hypothetical protein